MAKAPQTDEEKAADAAAAILCTEQGQTLMAFLRKKKISRTNFPSSGDGQSKAMAMSFQEGERSIVFYLESLIEKGKNRHG